MLKYCNELSGTIDLQSTINQAEVLFVRLLNLFGHNRQRRQADPGAPSQLSFRSLVEDVDRRQALRDSTPELSEGLRNRKSASYLASGEQLDEDEDFSIPHLPAISDDLRSMLE